MAYTLTMNIAAVNDAPTAANATLNGTEDTDYTFATADFGFSDVDAGDTLSAVRIDTQTLPSGASLKLSGTSVTNGQIIPAASIPNLVFSPAANANGAGYASFTFSVRDTGGPAFDAVPNTITFNVTAVNDRPVIDLDGDDTEDIDDDAAFTEDQANPTTLAPGAQVSDVDNSNLTSAQVKITNILDGNLESLAASGCVAAITVTPYNSASGVLALGRIRFAGRLSGLSAAGHIPEHRPGSELGQPPHHMDPYRRRPCQFAAGGNHRIGHTGQ